MRSIRGEEWKFQPSVLSVGPSLLTAPPDVSAGGKGPPPAPPRPPRGCVVLIFAASVRNKFASTFRPAAFVFCGEKDRRQKPSHEEAEQNGAHRPRPSLELKTPHSVVIHRLPRPPQPRACMKTKRLALLNDCKDCLLIQKLTLLYYSAPAFPLLQGGGWGGDRTEEERRGEKGELKGERR